ncbi:unnamed protein product [Blepharisma stoltei]|uniref:Centromere protein J C-terminal domain-containing protein n=1 Tax=Blepharisma stoltei TaxID=1481888 RepID=A0AAU9IKG1_9CILI|nr:unnamed protein product [Blepharisma stoltei]
MADLNELKEEFVELLNEENPIENPPKMHEEEKTEWGTLNEEIEYIDPQFRSTKSSLDSQELSYKLEKKLELLDFELNKFKNANEKLETILKSAKDKEKDAKKLNETLEKKLEQVKLEQSAWVEKQQKAIRQREKARKDSQKNLAAAISHNEREEFNNLKQQFQALQEERKRKENRDNKVISKLTREKMELQNKLFELEERSRDRRRSPIVPASRSTAETQTPIEEEKGNIEALTPIEIFSAHSRVLEVVKQSTLSDGRVQKTLADGHILIVFPDGMRQEKYQNNYKITYFPNRDIKQDFPDGSTQYFFAETGAFQKVYANGKQTIRFNNGQTEKHYNDGSKKIIYPDGTVKRITSNGEEVCMFMDGVVERTDNKGVKQLIHPGGNIEMTETN